MNKSSYGLTALPKSYVSHSKTEKEHFRLGFANLDRHKYNRAVSHFTKIIAADPKNSMAYYYRGIAKIYLQNPKGAINDLTIACSIPLLTKGGYFGDPANLLQ